LFVAPQGGRRNFFRDFDVIERREILETKKPFSERVLKLLCQAISSHALIVRASCLQLLLFDG
jgi:hypothetical protein